MPAPNLQIERLPASRDDSEKAFLQQQYNVQAKALERTPMTDVQFKTKILQLQTKTTMEWNKIEQGRRQKSAEREQVQRLIRGGTSGQSREEEAGTRMQLGPEAEKLVYQKEKYLTPQYLRSKGFIENVAAYAGQAEDLRGLEWGPPKKQKQDLVEQYQRWRQSELYDTKNPAEKQQLDREWDMMMFSSPVFKNWWKSKDKREPITEVKALRATGRISRAIREKVVGKSPIGASISRKSEMAHGFSVAASGYRTEGRPRPAQKKLTKDIARQYLNRYGNRQAAMEAAQADGLIE